MIFSVHTDVLKLMFSLSKMNVLYFYTITLTLIILEINFWLKKLNLF